MSGDDDIRPPWWLKPMNKVMMAAMRVGLMREGPMVLSVVGRNSGTPRPTPLMAVQFVPLTGR